MLLKERGLFSPTVEPGLIASIALTILSGAIGNTMKVAAKSGYEVSLFLWLIIVAKSGEGKTPAIGTLMGHVEKLQAKAMQEFTRLNEDNTSDHDTLLDVEKPTLRHYLVSDCTVEALSNVYEENGRGIIVHRDEISSLILGFDQYKRKGNDRQHYIELFNGGSWKIDRKSGSKFIPNTGAAIVGGIQPKRLPQIFRDDSFDDGLFPRFLLYLSGSYTLTFNRIGISAHDMTYWEQLVAQCYGITLNYRTDGFIKPRVLTIRSEALAVWQAFHNKHGVEIRYLSDRMSAIMNKLLAYYSLKFAGLLHVIKGFHEATPLRHPINKETIQHAILLTNFFAGHAARALQLYQEKGSLDEYQQQLIKTLFELRENATGGTLQLSKITELLNNRLPVRFRLTPEKIASMMRKLGLKTEKGAKNRSYLLWESEKLENLFSKITPTTVTSVAQDRPEHDGSTDEPKRIVIPRRRRLKVRNRLHNPEN